jgi:hypothetical protein
MHNSDDFIQYILELHYVNNFFLCDEYIDFVMEYSTESKKNNFMFYNRSWLTLYKFDCGDYIYSKGLTLENQDHTIENRDERYTKDFFNFWCSFAKSNDLEIVKLFTYKTLAEFRDQISVDCLIDPRIIFNPQIFTYSTYYEFEYVVELYEKFNHTPPLCNDPYIVTRCIFTNDQKLLQYCDQSQFIPLNEIINYYQKQPSSTLLDTIKQNYSFDEIYYHGEYLMCIANMLRDKKEINNLIELINGNQMKFSFETYNKILSTTFGMHNLENDYCHHYIIQQLKKIL